MATGWNYTLGESWHEYIQRRTITNDLTESHRESSRAMVSAVSAQTASILTGIESGTSAIVDGLESGFGRLNDQMDAVSGELSELNASFEWGFGHMLAQMGGMNMSLKQLIQIARTPVQTWAYNQFEIARENFRKGLYSNCLKRLDKAIQGDQTSPGYEEDWRFHQMIGVIRLGFVGCEMELVDLGAAERAFLQAAHYARVDEPNDAARAMLSAGWSAFVQGKSVVARKYTDEAIALDPNLAEAFFQAAKIEMAANAPQRALPMLRKAIEQSPQYVVKAGADGDFRRHLAELDSFYLKLRGEVFGVARPVAEKALREAEEWSATIPEVAECSTACNRWRGVLSQSWGLLELLTYQKDHLAQDRQALDDARSRGLARMAAERQAAVATEERERRKQEEAEAVAEATRRAQEKRRSEQAARTFWFLMIPVSWFIGGYVGWTIAHWYFEDPHLQVLLGVPMGALGAIGAQAVPYSHLEP